MKLRLGLLSAACLLVLAHAIPAAADTVYLSTGTAVYLITSDTNGAGDGSTVYPVTTLAAGWLANPITDGVGDSGSWIAPNADQSSNRAAASGSTTYVTYFSLYGLDPTSAVLTMNLAADDFVTVILNGHIIFSPSPSQTSNGMWTAASGVFTLTDATSYFNAVNNTLEFIVANDSGDGATNNSGPTGLAVAASINANEVVIPPQEVPEPTSLSMIGGGAFLLGLLVRCRKA